MSRRFARAIVHVGVEKTGTTSIQAFLASNVEALHQQGFAYPRTCGLPANLRLVVFSKECRRCEDLCRLIELDSADAREGFLATFPGALAAEIEALPRSVHTLILSSEHFFSRLNEPAEIERLRAVIAPLAERMIIMIYLRRQDRLAVSRYTTLLYNGYRRESPLPPPDAPRLLYDFDAGLNLWADAVGEDAIVPRLFGESRQSSDIVGEFARACGIDLRPGLVRPERLNRSLNPCAQALLRRLNQLGGHEKPVDPIARRLFHRLIGASCSGPGRLPSRAEAHEFLGRFAAGNERVRRRWLPEQARLFDEEFDHYPETADPEPPADEQADLLLALLLDTLGGETSLRAEILYHKARAAHGKLKVTTALAQLRRALELDPGHEGAAKLLRRLEAPRAAPSDPGPRAPLAAAFRRLKRAARSVLRLRLS